MHNSACLRSIAPVDPSRHLGKDTHLTSVSETGGILLWLPIDAIIETGDMLLLWTIFRSVRSTPLVTSFTYQNCSEVRLHVVISVAYANRQLHVLSEPESTGEYLVFENLAVQLTSGHLHRYHVLFLREKHHGENWRFLCLQPMTLSPTVMLTVIESVTDTGMFCSGPTDPWSTVENVASATLHAIYWIPRAVYASVSSSIHQMLHVQVSTCPFWAFSTQQHRICFLVHQLIY